MKEINFKIIFFGTPSVGANILEGLAKNKYKPVLTVTTPDKPAGRKQKLSPSPVKLTAQKYSIPVLQTEQKKIIREKTIKLKPDLIIAAGYGRIIPEEILNIPQYCSLNIHPSLLPKYRGPSPIQSAILNGSRQTGITIFKMDEKIDHGPIISSKKINISSDDTFDLLQEKLVREAIKLLLETIPKYVKNEIKPQKQNNSLASYSRIIKKEDGKIKWKSDSASIERKIRAFFPWPGTFTFWEKNDKKIPREKIRIKILEAKTEKEPKQNKNNKSKDTISAGKVFLTTKKELAVRCGKNSLVLKEIQIEGKKPTSGKDFLRGNSDFLGTILK